jgi:cytochrome c oxidase cbb3-type subunit III
MNTHQFIKALISKLQSYPLLCRGGRGGRPKRLIALLIFLPAFAFGQAPETKTFWNDPFNDPMLPVYVVSMLVFITIILVLITAVYMLRILNLLVRKQAEEKAAREGRVYVVELSWWAKFWDNFNASVPLNKESDIDLGHDYDGIRELDNHLPPWWKGILYISIVWGIGYMIMYHVSFSLPLSGEEYSNEVSQADAAKKALLASQPAAVIDENTLVYDANAEYIAKGKVVFTGNNCQSCHRDDGGGNGIGPNLTDNFWIHGGSMKNVFTTIKNGVVEKGMPAWGKVMSPQDVRNVAFYVMSLRGTNPPNPKAPQGTEYLPVEVTHKADTTVTANLNP